MSPRSAGPKYKLYSNRPLISTCSGSPGLPSAASRSTFAAFSVIVTVGFFDSPETPSDFASSPDACISRTMSLPPTNSPRM